MVKKKVLGYYYKRVKNIILSHITSLWLEAQLILFV